MYGKFFASTFEGSMMAAGADVFAVWAYVIAKTVDASVELNPRLLAAVIGSTPERMQAAIDHLCAPDPASRSTAEQGCRLVRQGQYQYHVTNHAAYKAIRNEDDRRAYNREAKRRERANKSNGMSMTVNDCQAMSTMSAQAEAEAEAEAKTKVKTKRVSSALTTLPARARDALPVEDSAESTGTFAPTFAGRVGMAFKAAGVSPGRLNLSDPRLTELQAQGATVEEFAGLAAEAVQRGIDNPWPWVLATLPARRKQASKIALGPAMINKQEAIEAKNRAVGADWLRRQEPGDQA